MKKYEKPAIEEFNIGATMPLMASSTSGNLTDSPETGFDTDYFSPGRKDKGDDFGDDDW